MTGPQALISLWGGGVWCVAWGGREFRDSSPAGDMSGEVGWREVRVFHLPDSAERGWLPVDAGVGLSAKVCGDQLVLLEGLREEIVSKRCKSSGDM